MIKISKTVLREEISNYLELGLTNAEIADRLNEKYGADEKTKLNAIKVGKLKKAVGLEGTKPKGKQLFELVDDEEEPVSQLEAYEVYADLAEPEYEPQELLFEPAEVISSNPNSIY